MSHETELRRRLRDELSKPDEMRNKQYDYNETLRMTKEIRVSILIEENETLIKKKKSKLRYSPKRIEIKTLIFNTYEIRETTIHKELPRRLTP